MCAVVIFLCCNCSTVSQVSYSYSPEKNFGPPSIYVCERFKFIIEIIRVTEMMLSYDVFLWLSKLLYCFNKVLNDHACMLWSVEVAVSKPL